MLLNEPEHEGTNQWNELGSPWKSVSRAENLGIISEVWIEFVVINSNG